MQTHKGSTCKGNSKAQGAKVTTRCKHTRAAQAKATTRCKGTRVAHAKVTTRCEGTTRHENNSRAQKQSETQW